MTIIIIDNNNNNNKNKNKNQMYNIIFCVYYGLDFWKYFQIQDVPVATKRLNQYWLNYCLFALCLFFFTC